MGRLGLTVLAVGTSCGATGGVAFGTTGSRGGAIVGSAGGSFGAGPGAIFFHCCAIHDP